MFDFPGGVYAITPETADTGKLLAQVEAALSGGVAAVQYRDKSTDVARRHEQASELITLCHRYNVPLIVNDDLRLREARIILGKHKLIGASCYQSLDQARAAQAAGADYVAFGSFFPSSTKPAAARADAELLRQATQAIHVPIVAIGGITPANAPALLDAGADSLAVLTALFDATDIRTAAQYLNHLFEAEPEE
jgi:thiamine-phosphate pyrophosphorylase